jgi:hypothetical protein
MEPEEDDPVSSLSSAANRADRTSGIGSCSSPGRYPGVRETFETAVHTAMVSILKLEETIAQAVVVFEHSAYEHFCTRSIRRREARQNGPTCVQDSLIHKGGSNPPLTGAAFQRTIGPIAGV